MDYSTPSFPVLHHLPEFAQTHVYWVGDAIQPSHSLSSPSPSAFNLSHHEGPFKWVSSLHQVATVLELQHQSFQWIFRADLLQNGLVGSACSPRDSQESYSTPQFKASILWHSAFFMVQLSHLYMTAGKTIALTIWFFVSKLMSLLFNILSTFIIAFLPRSKRLLISWLLSPSAVILEPKKIKCHCFHFLPFYLPWSDGIRCHDANFLNLFLMLSFKPDFPLSSFTFMLHRS